jgi:hypothetical protein
VQVQVQAIPPRRVNIKVDCDATDPLSEDGLSENTGSSRPSPTIFGHFLLKELA